MNEFTREEILRAEQEGRLLVLPCKIGGKLWRICRPTTTARSSASVRVQEVKLTRNNFWSIVVEGEFGKTVFLTCKEAAAAAEEQA